MANRYQKRGRLYSCLHCERKGSSYHEAKYRIESHVLKYHKALEETSYYCTLCLFRCTTLDKLQGHVTKYKPHMDRAGSTTDHSVYLRHNSSARGVVEGVDFRVLLPAEQVVSTSDHFEGLDFLADTPQDDLSLSEMLASPVTLPIAGETPSATKTSSSLISVQLTKEQLAVLLNQQPASEVPATGMVSMQPHNATPVLAFPVTATSVQTAYPSTVRPSLLTPPPPVQRMATPPLLASTLSTPLLDERVTPLKVTATTTSRPPLMVQDSPTNLLVTSQRLPPVPTVDQGCQTEGQPDKSLDHVFKETMAKVSWAIESNARAIRAQDKTLQQVVDALDKIGQTLGRLDRTAARAADRHASPNKENQPPAKRTCFSGQKFHSVNPKK